MRIVRRVRLLAIAAAAVASVCSGIGASPAAAASHSPNPSIVLCHDPVRDIVTRRLAQACDGKVVSAAEAAAIKARRQDRLRRILNRATAAPGSRRISIGTGFFVADGVIVTSKHVVEGCTVVSVETPAGETTSAEVLASDAGRDLALLGVAIAAPARAAFRAAGVPEPGDIIATVGYPTQGLAPIKPILIAGPIFGDPGQLEARSLVRFQAALRSGNSGGPLLDGDGYVIGVVTGRVDSVEIYKRTGRRATDIGFAIRHEAVQGFLADAGVAYRRQGDGSAGANPANLADPRDYVARIECWA